MTHKEIKEYVISTIRVGDKERIKSVLKRYYAYLKKPAPTLYDEAKEMFNAN